MPRDRKTSYFVVNTEIKVGFGQGVALMKGTSWSNKEAAQALLQERAGDSHRLDQV